MQTVLVERKTPPTVDFNDPEVLAQHCRWAADAYQAIGAAWLGGVVTDDGMFSLVAVEHEDDLRTYWRSLGIPDADIRIRRVLQPLGPSLAAPRAP